MAGLPISTAPKLTLGSVTELLPAVVSAPVRMIEPSHSAGLVPSLVVGKCWASAQESAGAYAVPFHCWVVTDLRRTVDQNVGPVTWQELPEAQWSWL